MKRLGVAQKRLLKDLDVRTYLRSVNKVKGLCQSLLDDKQRIMLKFNKHTQIETIKMRGAQEKATEVSEQEYSAILLKNFRPNPDT